MANIVRYRIDESFGKVLFRISSENCTFVNRYIPFGAARFVLISPNIKHKCNGMNPCNLLYSFTCLVIKENKVKRVMFGQKVQFVVMKLICFHIRWGGSGKLMKQKYDILNFSATAHVVGRTVGPPAELGRRGWNRRSVWLGQMVATSLLQHRLAYRLLQFPGASLHGCQSLQGIFPLVASSLETSVCAHPVDKQHNWSGEAGSCTFTLSHTSHKQNQAISLQAA